MSLRPWLLLSGLLSLLFVTGCGAAPEKLVPVGGKVLIDGEALDGVEVRFIPDVAKKDSRGGSGTTDATGSFTVTSLDQNLPGLAPGKYTVAFSRRRLPDGSAPPAAADPSKPGVIRVETFPTHLTTPDPDVPLHQVEIPKEGNTKLELKASKKKNSALMGPG